MIALFKTYEAALAESERLGRLIRERNQAYLDKRGEGKVDNTERWDWPKEQENGWSLQAHDEMQGDFELIDNGGL